jgi:hypothetical protein
VESGRRSIVATVIHPDRETLVSFVRYAYEFVQTHIRNGGDLSKDIEIDKDMRLLLMDAWAEYERQFPLSSVEAGIRATPLEVFAAAGLTEAQWAVKNRSNEKKIKRYEKEGGEKPFGKVVESIDDILKSFPSSFLWREPLAELKDVMARNINSRWFRILKIDISSWPIRAVKRFWKKLTSLRNMLHA